MAEQAFGDDKLQNGVAKKLQTLIIQVIQLHLVSHTRMRERLCQEERISKFVADAFFERSHFLPF